MMPAMPPKSTNRAKPRKKPDTALGGRVRMRSFDGIFFSPRTLKNQKIEKTTGSTNAISRDVANVCQNPIRIPPPKKNSVAGAVYSAIRQRLSARPPARMAARKTGASFFLKNETGRFPNGRRSVLSAETNGACGCAAKLAPRVRTAILRPARFFATPYSKKLPERRLIGDKRGLRLRRKTRSAGTNSQCSALPVQFLALSPPQKRQVQKHLPFLLVERSVSNTNLTLITNGRCVWLEENI